ncbi:MAG: universal stress protein [Kiritimatiellia bacterium]|jgi:nucleotide-binding universal stress UspA family protein
MNATDLRRGHYRRILFCTDFSANADAAFDFAIDAAIRSAGGELCLLHAIPEPDAQFWRGYISDGTDMNEKARAGVEAKIDADYRPRVPAGLPFRVEIQVGSAAKTIIAFAKEENADLIVLGQQGRGAIGRWLLGNVASKVVCQARCPVLIVPSGAVISEEKQGN